MRFLLVSESIIVASSWPQMLCESRQWFAFVDHERPPTTSNQREAKNKKYSPSQVSMPKWR
jgi:hypothetical protein